LEDRGNSQIPLHCDIIFLRVRENRTRSQGEDVQENHSGCRRQRIRRLSTKYSQLHLRGIMRVPASGQVIEIDGRIRCSTEDTCGQFTCSQFDHPRALAIPIGSRLFETVEHKCAKHCHYINSPTIYCGQKSKSRHDCKKDCFASLVSPTYPKADLGHTNANTNTGTSNSPHFPANHRPGPKLETEKPGENNNNGKARA
jgi:hypothetical protein